MATDYGSRLREIIAHHAKRLVEGGRYTSAKAWYEAASVHMGRDKDSKPATAEFMRPGSTGQSLTSTVLFALAETGDMTIAEFFGDAPRDVLETALINAIREADPDRRRLAALALGVSIDAPPPPKD